MKICYVHLGNNNSADRVLIRGLRENGVTVVEISDNSPGFKKITRVLQAFKREEAQSPCNSILVGYTAAIFVPWMKLVTRKPVIYYALSSFYESMIVSRNVGGPFSFHAFKYWVLDYLAFSSAKFVLIESEAQKLFINKRFMIGLSKLIIHRAGVDETIFHQDSSIKKNESFTVLFRGKLTPEAGVEVLLEAAHKLEKERRNEIKFRILGHGFLQKKIEALITELNLKNVELVTKYLSDQQLRIKMLECHVALGQLSNHPRLRHTIPFKAYESMSMQLPFLTARNQAVMEVFTENETCISFNPGDSDDLAQKILFAYENPDLLKKIAGTSYALYSETFTPKKLTEKLLQSLY